MEVLGKLVTGFYIFLCLTSSRISVKANAIEDFITTEVSRQFQLGEMKMKKEILAQLDMKLEEFVQKKVPEPFEASSQCNNCFFLYFCRVDKVQCWVFVGFI